MQGIGLFPSVWKIHEVSLPTTSLYESYRKSGFLTHPPDKMAAILADDIFKCIFQNENDSIPIQISLKFVPVDPINNSPASNKRQAIFWTNADPIHWRIFATLSVAINKTVLAEFTITIYVIMFELLNGDKMYINRNLNGVSLSKSKIQSGAVITRPNLSRYYHRHCDDCSRM